MKTSLLYNHWIHECGALPWNKLLYIYATKRVEHPKYFEEPNNYSNYNHYIKNGFNFMIHRDIIINKPEQDSRNN
jgi:hypothetical protein